MVKIFSNNRIIFYSINFVTIALYVFPGSILGLAVYNDINIQPQITPNFIISSNHFYVFFLVSVIGCFTFIKRNQIKFLIVYLILLSIALELLHLIIPERTFQWSDLFGNLVGVIVVILIKNLINKYEVFKK